MRIEALNGRGEVLLPIIARTLLATLAMSRSTQTTTRGSSAGVAEPGRVFTEEERSAGSLGLHGAARDHRAVQYRTRCQSRPLRRVRLRPRLPVRPGRPHADARRRASATSCCTCPTKSWSSTITRPRPGTTATTIPATAFRPTGLPRDSEAEPFSRPTAFRRAATTSPANMPSSSTRRRRASGAATCSRSCPARCSTSAAKPRRRRFRAG